MKVTCPTCKRRIRIKKTRKPIQCKCGHTFNWKEYWVNDQVYLVDANIIIYALQENKHMGCACQGVFNQSNVTIATTDTVMGEIKQEVPYRLKIYKFSKMKDDLGDLHAGTLKQPSEVDLSLVQVAVNNPEIKGIITYDHDFERIAVKGIVSSYGGSFWIGNAHEFLKKIHGRGRRR